MEPVFFKLLRVRFSRAKGKFKCQGEQDNLVTPAPCQEWGATSAGCPLHHCGTSGDGEVLSNQRLRHIQGGKPLSRVGIKYFLASHHPIPVTKGSASRPSCTRAEAGSTGCFFWVRHAGSGDETSRTKNLLTLQHLPIKQPRNSPQVGRGAMSTEDNSSQKIQNLMQVRESWEKEKVIAPLSHKKESFEMYLEVRDGSS